MLTRRRRVLLSLYRILEISLRRVADWAETLAVRLSYCPTCGRNRYTGKPCVSFDEIAPQPPFKTKSRSTVPPMAYGYGVCDTPHFKELDSDGTSIVQVLHTRRNGCVNWRLDNIDKTLTQPKPPQSNRPKHRFGRCDSPHWREETGGRGFQYIHLKGEDCVNWEYAKPPQD